MIFFLGRILLQERTTITSDDVHISVCCARASKMQETSTSYRTFRGSDYSEQHLFRGSAGTCQQLTFSARARSTCWCGNDRFWTRSRAKTKSSRWLNNIDLLEKQRRYTCQNQAWLSMIRLRNVHSGEGIHATSTPLTVYNLHILDWLEFCRNTELPFPALHSSPLARALVWWEVMIRTQGISWTAAYRTVGSPSHLATEKSSGSVCPWSGLSASS